jgi:predicted glycoside hydrolase/deacetylase ChbG (UPF0249 family)
MKKYHLLLLLLALLPFLTNAQSRKPRKIQPAKVTTPVQLLLRCDDVGMCHAVNMATKQLIETGIPFSTSVMFGCPWYTEAVKILKDQPQIAVGVHLMLGSEWKNYRWGPVAGREAVPSLVDSLGLFYPTPGALIAAKPRMEDIEKEFRAQIDRALKSGLTITYLDNHMGAGLYSPEQMDLMEKLAKEYKLGISSFHGEENLDGFGRYPLEAQQDTLYARIKRLKPGAPRFIVFHLGQDVPEMQALEDSNQAGTRQMSKQRQHELNMLSNPAFRELIKANNIKLITYKDLIAERGLQNLKRPVKK